ncbi:hypothetical protein D1AOALGA4SA_3034 [Olavius algarvensis Delta 1 endosymbiont]|nr:hypothetical protein D1AOALGA4SA_3034 [Olavius algarvensis Delta 1 endosymbiont]
MRLSEHSLFLRKNDCIDNHFFGHLVNIFLYLAKNKTENLAN